jgi:hypothetical protein
MTGGPNDCSPETDEMIREFCAENDVGQMKGCPKCGIGCNGESLIFCNFCQHPYCPIREWRANRRKQAPDTRGVSEP